MTNRSECTALVTTATRSAAAVMSLPCWNVAGATFRGDTSNAVFSSPALSRHRRSRTSIPGESPLAMSRPWSLVMTCLYSRTGSPRSSPSASDMEAQMGPTILDTSAAQSSSESSGSVHIAEGPHLVFFCVFLQLAWILLSVVDGYQALAANALLTWRSITAVHVEVALQPAQSGGLCGTL